MFLATIIGGTIFSLASVLSLEAGLSYLFILFLLCSFGTLGTFFQDI